MTQKKKLGLLKTHTREGGLFLKKQQIKSQPPPFLMSRPECPIRHPFLKSGTRRNISCYF